MFLSGNVMAFFSIIISLFAVGVCAFCFFRMYGLEKMIEKETTANRARIGRLIQELNILHEEKRKRDERQDMELGIA